MSFADAELTRDAFLDGRLRLWQPRRGYRAATDPVLLAAFVPARPGERVLELGCGAGAAALCLAARVPGLDLHGLELQPAYADLARRNAAENGLALTCTKATCATRRRRCGAGFDHVLANPPFHPAASAGSPDPGRDRAHREGEATLADWIDAGLRRLLPGGRLVLIHRTARLGDDPRRARRPRRRRRDPADRLARRPAGGAGARPRAQGTRRRADALAALNLPFGDAHAGDARDPILPRRSGCCAGMAALLPDARVGGSTPP